MGAMPWKEVLPMEERAKFVLRVKKAEESFARLCREYAISRKTGYKWWSRFCEQGLEGLRERSSRPWRSPRRSGVKWQEGVIQLRGRYPFWGPKKLRAKLEQTCRKGEVVPAASTLGMILQRGGLARGRRRRGARPQIVRGVLREASGPNEIWAVDFKGWFRTGNGQRCDPLTISDLATRYVLCCRALEQQSFALVYHVMEGVFKIYGLPGRIRVDNGSPFAGRGAGGLSRLSVWWMRLGIGVEFITPGHPQENGSHERMHRTLKAETVYQPAYNLTKQQHRFDRWRRYFNTERPHESLGQQPPAKLYRSSTRTYSQQNELLRPHYPQDWAVRRVRSNGEIRWRGHKRFIGEALVGELIGLHRLTPTQHAVYFMERLLGTLHDAEADFTGLRPTAYVLQNQRNGEQKV